MSLWTPEDSLQAAKGMPEARKTIQECMSEQPSITKILGLDTEEECFKALQSIGDAKFMMKDTLDSLLKSGEDHQSSKVKELSVQLMRAHTNQKLIINDICKRFHVIHPEIEQPTEEMLKVSQPYWDWYNAMYKKVFHKDPPPVIKSEKPHLTEEEG